MARRRVRLTKRSKDTLKLLKEISKRQKSLKKYVVSELAGSVQEEVVSRIPRGFPEYTASITTAQVGESACLVFAKGTEQAAIDSEDDVLVVVTARNLRTRPDPAVLLLESSGPWTPDTLPFVPSPRVADLTYSRVSPDRAAKVASARRAAYPVLRRKFAALGVRLPILGKRRVAPPGVVGGVAKDGLALEFGMGKGSKPHWRIGVNVAVNDFIRGFWSRREVVSLFTELKYTGWKLWGLPSKSVSERELASFEAFQEKLGLL